MSSLVEAIAKQAQSTFSRCLTDECFAENLTKLIRNVSRIRATDLNFNKDSVCAATDNDGQRPAPVIYIEVAENQAFSMGIFLLRNGTRIPLHDHPGMHGVLKVIQGTVQITSFSKIQLPPGSKPPQDINNRVKGVARDLLIPVEKHSSAILTDRDEPCVLSPNECNYHDIVAVGGMAAFLDILAPPYDMKARNCHYYVPMETKKTDSEAKTWLLRTPPPCDYWCRAAPYTGPKFTL
ncbi:hypothetical protein JTE90_018687 [Oedothorax gibbosus]|uniref:2-aminoethanethiol dioxygenase n=1 Tax=Oedothorax gibbosus TaxID=931172 RepID=A0AAV6UZY0_9ARAC|nr:hypothetical protein JTE90_018687 [Oedothorax gibbosus]